MIQPDRTYRVTIFYQEPTYTCHRGGGERLFRGTFHVRAADPHSASEHAQQKFRQYEALSWVGWQRGILWMVVREAR